MISASGSENSARIATFIEELTHDVSDSVSFELMTQAVILNCGHSFNESTVITLPKSECPECRAPIIAYTTDYKIRSLAAKMMSVLSPVEQQTSETKPAESKSPALQLEKENAESTYRTGEVKLAPAQNYQPDVINQKIAELNGRLYRDWLKQQMLEYLNEKGGRHLYRVLTGTFHGSFPTKDIGNYYFLFTLKKIMDAEYCDFMRNDKEIILAAVSDTPKILAAAGKELKNDRNFVLTAVLLNDLAFEVVGEELSGNAEFQFALATQLQSEDFRKLNPGRFRKNIEKALYYYELALAQNYLRDVINQKIAECRNILIHQIRQTRLPPKPSAPPLEKQDSAPIPSAPPLEEPDQSQGLETGPKQKATFSREIWRKDWCEIVNKTPRIIRNFEWECLIFASKNYKKNEFQTMLSELQRALNDDEISNGDKKGLEKIQFILKFGKDCYKHRFAPFLKTKDEIISTAITNPLKLNTVDGSSAFVSVLQGLFCSYVICKKFCRSLSFDGGSNDSNAFMRTHALQNNNFKILKRNQDSQTPSSKQQAATFLEVFIEYYLPEFRLKMQEYASAKDFPGLEFSGPTADYTMLHAHFSHNNSLELKQLIHNAMLKPYERRSDSTNERLFDPTKGKIVDATAGRKSQVLPPKKTSEYNQWYRFKELPPVICLQVVPQSTEASFNRDWKIVKDDCKVLLPGDGIVDLSQYFDIPQIDSKRAIYKIKSYIIDFKNKEETMAYVEIQGNYYVCDAQSDFYTQINKDSFYGRTDCCLIILERLQEDDDWIVF